MRFATYNIRHGAPSGQLAHTGLLRGAVRSLDADVLALQEVDRRVVRSWFVDQTRLLARATDRRGVFAPARRLWLGWYGVALLVPEGSVQSRVVRLRSQGEQRVALFSRVRLSDRSGSGFVTVVCTHLQNATGPSATGPGASEAAAQLDEVLEELAQWPAPWVVMGDLNLRAAEVVPRLEGAGLDVVPTGPTFSARRPKSRIDWVGVRGLEIGAVEQPPLPASDHLPIVVDLTWPATPR